MTIRDATRADAGRICAIWNAAICDSLVTFTTEEKRPVEIAREISQTAPGFLVVEIPEGKVVGFAKYGTFRTGPGYAFSKEHTIMLAEDARGKGVGRALMDELERVAGANGVHCLIGGISGANTEGIAFHSRIGFQKVGVLRQAGYKAGQWIDLIFMQKIITQTH